jgi:serine/threonine-protein kinase
MPNQNAPGWENAPFAGSAWATNRDAGIAANILIRSFGAIAYSPSTGRYGWSYQAIDRPTAERIAIDSCGASDAMVVVWGTKAFLALAIADAGAYGWGWDETPSGAQQRALAGCQGANPRIAVVFDTRRG